MASTVPIKLYPRRIPLTILNTDAAVQFNFSTSQLVISEGGDLPGQLSIVKTGQHQGNITVDIELTSTHPNNRDYTVNEVHYVFTSETFTLPVGIHLIGDRSGEEIESFNLRLVLLQPSISADIVSPGQVTVVIIDDDSVVVGFLNDNSSVTIIEGDPPQTICLEVKEQGLRLDPFDRVPINIMIESEIPGTPVEFGMSQLVFETGTLTRCTTISIPDNTIYDGTRSSHIVINRMASTVPIMVYPRRIPLTILDNDVEVQRIYQGRISIINTQVNVDIYEVIGLASIELEAGSSNARPTYFFDCNTTLNNGSGITWLYNGDTPRFRVGPIPTSTNGKRLSAAGITESDLGLYNCVDTYTNTNVSINITQDNPAILPVNRVLRIMLGTPATLQVYVSGYPLVASSQIHWYRPNGTEILEGQARFGNDRRTMFLSEVQSTDGGLYRCEVNTRYGDRSTMIQLDVYANSDIVSHPSLADTTLERDDVTLSCSASAIPLPNITWEKEGGAIPSTTTVFTTLSDTPNTVTSVLTFSDIRFSDAGRYRCVADNGKTLPATSNYAQIRVIRRPGSGSGVTFTRWGKLSCPNATEAQLVYTGRVGGTSHRTQGGAAEKVCMPEDPDYTSETAGLPSSIEHGRMFGSEYQLNTGPYSLRDVYQHYVPCAVCYVPTRATTIMVPAKTVCPSSWTREYYGYLMSEGESEENYRSSYNCIDANPDIIPNRHGSTNGTLLYYVQSTCNGFACPPYQENRILSCVVCTK